MEGLSPVSVELNSVPVVLEDEALTYLNASYPDLGDTIAPNNQDYPAVTAADLAKYVPETEQYCKILGTDKSQTQEVCVLSIKMEASGAQSSVF